MIWIILYDYKEIYCHYIYLNIEISIILIEMR